MLHGFFHVYLTTEMISTMSVANIIIKDNASYTDIAITCLGRKTDIQLSLEKL